MRAFFLGGGALSLALLFAGASCGDDGNGEQLCDPGSNVFCRCRGTREAGTKVCNEAGDGFGSCETGFGECEEIEEEPSSGAGNNTGAGGGMPKPPDPGDLFAPCDVENNQLCNEGLECGAQGYCTKACEDYQECTAAGDCIVFGTNQRCAPYCDQQSDCDVYSASATCGYTEDAVPTFGVVVCAQWGDELALPPDGYPLNSECNSDVLCNLGFEGTERVCSATGCTDGCHVGTDCSAAGATCSSDGTTLGTCGGMSGEDIDKCPGVTVTLTAAMPSVQRMGDTSQRNPPSEAEGVDQPPKLCTSESPTEEDVYRLVIPQGGDLIINVDGASSYDPIIYVRSGNCATGMQQQCEDSNGAGTGEILELLAFDNDELWVFVDGYNGSTGSYTIDFDLTVQ